MRKRIAGFLGVLASIAGILALLVTLNIIHPFPIPTPPTPTPTLFPTETPTLTPTPSPSPTPTPHFILLGPVDLNRYDGSWRRGHI